MSALKSNTVIVKTIRCQLWTCPTCQTDNASIAAFVVQCVYCGREFFTKEGNK